MDDDIPALRRPEDTPPIHTQQDLERQWRALMGPLGFGACKLWILLTAGDGTMVPHVITVEDNPVTPDDLLIENLGEQLRAVVDECVPDGRVAILWTRPGDGSLRDGDRAWVRGIHEGLVRAGLRTWPPHFANDVHLRVVAPDDLAA